MNEARRGSGGSEGDPGHVPGIVIADGGVGSRHAQELPRLRAFIYGERMPTAPTLPFGRWKGTA